jgi:DNA invertase Pin-like site-specific DNA recombinase
MSADCLPNSSRPDRLICCHVNRLDRLVRSTIHLGEIAARLEEKPVTLQVLDQSMKTGEATGQLLLKMLGAMAQCETDI